MGESGLSARIPRGFADKTKGNIADIDFVAGKVADVFSSYAFDPMETPIVEYSDALGKFLPDEDRPNEGVFSFRDDKDEWVSLRYDLTAPLARHVAQNAKTLQFPYRVSRSGYVFRNEKPGPDRYRQFMQFDADIVGTESKYSDAEICLALCQVMESLGFKKNQYRVKYGNRKIMDAALSKFLPDPSPERKTKAFRAFDKYDSLGMGEVLKLLQGGRLDESGDFTEGMGLSKETIDSIFFALRNVRSIGEEYIEDVEGLLRDESVILQTVSDAGFTLSYNPLLVRGIGYYTDFVVECSLTVDVPNDKGIPIKFGAVAGGGRYDGLIERFTGKKIPAVGVSIGVSRLAYAMRQLDMIPEIRKNKALMVIMEDMDKGNCYALADSLRSEGLRIEIYQGKSEKLGKQLNYANKRNFPVCVIMGKSEWDDGSAIVRDMVKGNQSVVFLPALSALIKDVMKDQECAAYPLLESRVS